MKKVTIQVFDKSDLKVLFDKIQRVVDSYSHFDDTDSIFDNDSRGVDGYIELGELKAILAVSGIVMASEQKEFQLKIKK
jgi:hypothetical protein